MITEEQREKYQAYLENQPAAKYRWAVTPMENLMFTLFFTLHEKMGVRYDSRLNTREGYIDVTFPDNPGFVVRVYTDNKWMRLYHGDTLKGHCDTWISVFSEIAHLTSKK